jgi:hypothetical protein
MVTGDTAILCLVPADVDPDDAKDESRGDVAVGDPVIARTDFDADEATPADSGPTAGIGDPRPEACTRNALVADAVVHEAELRVVDGRLVAKTIVLQRGR